MWGIFLLDTISNTTNEAITIMTDILPMIIEIMIISMVIGMFSYLIKKINLP